MHLFRGTAQRLYTELANGTLIPHLEYAFASRYLHRPNESEVRSWQHSLLATANELVAADLHEVQVLVEYSLPLTSKRVDVLLIGTHPQSGVVSAIVWENKQWTSGDLTEVEDRIVSVLGRRVLHPQQQVYQYVEYLADFNPMASNGELELHGLAFLHNATNAEVNPLRIGLLADLAECPMFSGDDLGALKEFLGKYISPNNAARAADTFLLAPSRPSKQFLHHVRDQISGHAAFTLLDEQKVAYDTVRYAIQESRRSNTKKVVIVKGGPGTGKSVIATELVGHLASNGYNIAHATGSRSFTTTLRRQVGNRAGNLFRYFNNFVETDANDLDVLIADEAHRIRENSYSRFTPRSKRSGMRQVDELIKSARVPVFFLDQHQVVRPGEIGTIDEIISAATRHNADVIEIDLDGQFRLGGSEAYYVWVQKLLGILPDGPIRWEGDERFELKLATSPDDAEAWVLGRSSEGYTARITAGFCWPWSDPIGQELVNDVVIGGWMRPWNLKPDKHVPGIPSSSLWATEPAGIGQVGCIYTAQGFEYDYGAVIMGRDLVWRDHRWESNPSESKDRIVSRSDEFGELAKHVYRVLLTRGLRGCLIYSVDDETTNFLSGLGIEIL